ncbi:hypothetical protein Tco_1521316 [Tanacetum coccineum]
MVKSWLVQDQTVLGKGYSNLLIADSLLKTIWFINAPCHDDEALASPKANELTIPEQTTTGKGKSNSFMAGSLPKTTKPTYWLSSLVGCKDLFSLGLTSTLPNADLPIDPNMPDLEDDSNAFPNNGIFSGAYDDEDVGAEADFNNMDNSIDVSPIPTPRVHKDYPKGQILGDPKSAVQTRGKIQKASSVQ